jgi:hypothetical protein
MNRFSIFLLAPLVIASCEIHLALAQTTAVSANDFLNSIGVVSAVSRRGEDLANTIKATKYLGLRWFRSGYESRVPVADLIELHNQTGVRFSYGLLSGGKFELVVWDERLSGSDNVTVNLGATFASVIIYDPTMGTSPIQSLNNVSSVALTLSNHPVTIEIPAQ